MDKNKTEIKQKTKKKITPQKEKGKKRNSVRIDIASPFTLRKLNLPFNKNRGLINKKIIHGMILNISGSGILAAIDTKLKVDSYVALKLDLRGLESIENVIGKAKRVEKIEHSEYLTGIEFVEQGELVGRFQLTDKEIITDELSNFNESVNRVISKYVLAKRLKQEAITELR